MPITTRQVSIARSAGLIVLAALGVHQLRYLLAYGPQAHESLTAQGHEYLLQALPILVGFAVAAIAATLLRAAFTGSSRAPALRSREGRILGYALAILVVFSIQETLEGAIFAGHASGTEAVLGAGGWLALPLAALLGAVCALLDGGLARLESFVAGAPAGLAHRPRAPRQRGSARGARSAAVATGLLGFGFARRPPPALS